MINALALTRAQICPKLNGKLFDSHDNIKLLRNNAKLFRNVAIYVAEIPPKNNYPGIYSLPSFIR